MSDYLRQVYREDGVRARHEIRQSPLIDAPHVPAGEEGEVVLWDEVDGALWVDFGEPYGVVICRWDDVE
jgi:hypothetical protein